MITFIENIAPNINDEDDLPPLIRIYDDFQNIIESPNIYLILNKYDNSKVLFSYQPFK